MVSCSVLASVAGAMLLVAVSIVCAGFSRTHRFLRTHVLDLWAMALVMIAVLPRDGTGGHHSVEVPASATTLIVIVGWALARIALAARAQRGTVDAASAAVTGAGLLVMAVICA